MKKYSGLLFVAFLLASCSQNKTDKTNPTLADSAKKDTPAFIDWREANAYSLGLQAYMYAFPTVYMSYLRHEWITNPKASFYAPFNKLHLKKELATAQNYTTGGTPNNDTQYSWGWLDLTKEPVIISVPDMGTRYYTFELADFYSDNFGYIGKRTTGTKAANYAILPPGWKGKLPTGIKQSFESPTPYALVFGRTLVDGQADVPNVNALMEQYKITPLSYLGKKDQTLPENHEIWGPYDNKTDSMADWKTINRAMTENPPPARDNQIISLMASIGIGANQPLDFSKMNPSVRRGLERAAADGKKMLRPIIFDGADISKNVNGWNYPPKTMGRAGYANQFVYRAALQCYGGIICNDPAEAVYLNCIIGGDKKHLTGKNNYTLHFNKDQIPPVKEFWSVSMYGIDHNFANNPINKYAIGDRSKDLKYNPDGSFDIYIQHQSPGKDKEGNWLPAPDGEFYLMLRAYNPKQAILDQTWQPPAMQIVH
jgi:hypothetical protein